MNPNLQGTVKMGDTLSFTDHIDTICYKVRQKSGWIIGTFNARYVHTMMKTPTTHRLLLPIMDTTLGWRHPKTFVLVKIIFKLLGSTISPQMYSHERRME